MPKSPNNLQFSLSSDYLEKLEKLANTGESLGLCAKRLLTEFLDGRFPSSSDLEPDYKEILFQLEQKLKDLEPTSDRLSQLEEKFRDLEQTGDRLSQLEQEYEKKTTNLSKRLDLLQRDLIETIYKINYAALSSSRILENPPGRLEPELEPELEPKTDLDDLLNAIEIIETPAEGFKVNDLIVWGKKNRVGRIKTVRTKKALIKFIDPQGERWVFITELKLAKLNSGD